MDGNCTFAQLFDEALGLLADSPPRDLDSDNPCAK